MKYSVPQHIDKNQIFLVNFLELEGRWDPMYYTDIFINNTHKIKRGVFPIKKLSEITILISDGTHFTPNYTQNGIKFLSVKDVRRSFINFNDTKFISETDALILDKRCKPQKNDILLTKIGTIGLASVVETTERFQIFVSLALIRPNLSIVHPKYLEIYINSRYANTQFLRNLKGAGVPDLHLEEIQKLLVIVPPLSIQQQIVDQYNTALKLRRSKIAFAKQKLASIDDYLLGELGITLPKNDFQKLNDRMFEVSFKDVLGNRYDPFYYQQKYTNFINSIANSKYTTIELKKGISFLESGGRPSGGADRYNQEVFSIGGEHVNDCFEVGNGTPKYIPLSYHFFMKKTETKINDIILVKDGATTGKVGIIENHNFVGQNINEHVFLMRCDKTVMLNHYLVYYLHSVIGQNLIAQKITGATIMGITKPSLNSILIPIPPLDKQNEIVAHISAIRAEAKALEIQAEEVLTKAREEVEKMILQSE